MDLLNNIDALHIRSECYVLDFYNRRTRKQEHMWGRRRPNLDTFLEYIFQAHDYVAAYTAAESEYANKIVPAIFKHKRPHFVFDRRDCLDFIDEDGYKDHTKPIKLLFERHPELAALGIDMNKVVMIDNKENNFKHNMSHGLVIPDYAPEPTIEGLLEDDKYLLAAINHLKKRSMRGIIKSSGEIVEVKEKTWIRSITDAIYTSITSNQ